MVRLRPENSDSKKFLARILDKGVVVDTRARVSLVDTDLLEIEAIMVLSSFKTAAKIGLHFPEGTNLNTLAWRNLITKQPCPVCGMESRSEDLKEEGCPWCGWNYRPDER